MGCVTSINYNHKNLGENSSVRRKKIYSKEELFCQWCGNGTCQIVITNDNLFVPCCDDCLLDPEELPWLKEVAIVQIMNSNETDCEPKEEYSLAKDEEDYKKILQAQEIDKKEKLEEQFWVLPIEEFQAEQDLLASCNEETENQKIRRERVLKIAEKIQSSSEFKESLEKD